MGLVTPLNAFIQAHLRTLELVGVLMRIFSFSLVSWLGPESPFLFVWFTPVSTDGSVKAFG